jgi:dynein heavy chain, axonemal
MKQEVNRRHSADKWALDDVVMTSTVTHPARDFENLKETAPEGVFVHGLFLDGAAWSKGGNRLIDAEPKELYSPLPVLHVTGVQAREKQKKDIFECPAYRVKKRTGLNFITTFPLRTEDQKSKWVLRGLALLCSKD